MGSENTTNHGASSETTAASSKTTRHRRLRLWPALILIALALVAHLIAWKVADGDLTLRVMFIYMIQVPFWAMMTVWWVFGSRIAWKYRFIGVLLVAAVITSLGLWVIRIETFSGDMIPQIAWKWTPTREELAAAYHAEHAGDSPAKASEVSSSEAPQQAALLISADDWPGYRGATRDGIAPPMKIRRNWNAAPKPLWKHPVGLGWSSFAIVGDYCFTQEQRLEDEVVACYHVRTGDEIWHHADPVRFSEALGGDGPRATPTVDDGKVYALGATGILNCLNALTGQKIWAQDILATQGAKNLVWGMSGSPLVYDDVVVVTPGAPEDAPADFDHAIIAYDRLTGDVAWHAGNRKGSYCAPQLNEVDGTRQLLVFDFDGMTGNDSTNGKLLWSFDWSTQPGVSTAQPIFVAPMQVFAGLGYGVGSTVRQIIHDGEKWDVAPEPVWTNQRFRLKFQTAVLHEGYLYGLSEGILTCVNAADGKQAWKQGRYKFGQLLLADGLLVVLAESGEVVLIEATPDGFQEVTSFQAIDGQTWNHPAISRGLLLVRNGAEAACYDIAEPTPPTVAVE